MSRHTGIQGASAVRTRAQSVMGRKRWKQGNRDETDQQRKSDPGTLRSFVLEEQRGQARTLRPDALRVPTLVVQGTDDYFVPAAVGEDLHRRLPRSKLVLVPHGSRMLPVTHADLLAQQIHEFLAPAEPHDQRM